MQEPKVWSASGRIGRLRYLGYIMGAYLLVLLAVALGGGIGAAMGNVAAAGIVTSVVMVVAMLPFMVLSIFTAIQRCHDLGWSGWMVLLSIVPLANIFVTLMWVFKAGETGANRFGPPPSPTPRSVKWLALSLPVVIGIGMVAAIALPQYAQYQQRAHAQQMDVAPQGSQP